MNAHLFVYGTLMPAATSRLGAHERSRLMAQARLLGSAELQGRLYDLGRYPGAVETAEPGARVYGALLLLTKPEDTFRWLDAYEGIAPGDPDPEYARRICPVTLADGTTAAAWVYLYRWPVRRGRLVPSGRWSANAAP